MIPTKSLLLDTWPNLDDWLTKSKNVALFSSMKYNSGLSLHKLFQDTKTLKIQDISQDIL